MSSQLDIYNLAIARVGIGTIIGDVTERSEPRRKCSQFYEQCRDECLRNFPWSFARKAQPLSLLSQEFPGWGYVYDYPNDCLFALEVIPEEGNRIPVTRWFDSWRDRQLMRAPKIVFERALRTDGQAQVLLTDLADAWLMYIARVDVVGLYDPDFVNMLAWRLAAEVGAPLKCDVGLTRNAWQTYELMRLRAGGNDLNEGNPDLEPDSPSIEARY